TEPVQSELPVKVHKRIRTRASDELDFDLHFEFVDESVDEQVAEGATAPHQSAEVKSYFRPAFLS
ncbi:MAG: hypothetical protein KDE50_07245, partial [Caldilineaceae bacterium]|nr:hypothetical protein [Caldilineaceae bacterium]